MLRVYMESEKHGYAEEVARFVDEETYMVCVKALEKLAKSRKMILTESVVEEETDALNYNEKNAV